MFEGSSLFIFLAAGALGLFSFLTVGAWVGGNSRERFVRDRFALLKTLAEQPGENAARVIEMLRKEDEERRQKRREEERRGWIDGGLVLIAVGVGLGAMLEIMATRSGAWAVGLIPLLLGFMLAIIGFFKEPGRKR
jgi:hypothetical protein